MTGGAFLALAGMMSVVIVFVTGLAVKAEVFGSEEAWEGITSVVMSAHFDEDDLLVLGWTLEDNLIVVIHGKDHDLVVGEMTLKPSEFEQSARSLRYTRLAMECLGLTFLNGSATPQAVVVGVTTSLFAIGFHGHDGTSATEFIVVLDLDDALFGIQ